MVPPVKFLPALLAVSLSAHAASTDPGTAALDFLEKVRLRKLNLEPGGDTALSAQTAVEKKQAIARRLERMAKDLGSDRLELGEIKQDENYAAVLVRKTGGFDPSRLQIFPLALVKRGTEWAVAPVPASFENAGTGYAVALRKRLELLENWMLREQVVDLENLRERSTSLLREKIEKSLPARQLEGYTAIQAAECFVEACERGNLSSVLGLLGGLAARLPDDWALRLKAADRALGSDSKPARPWILLSSADIVRVLVQHSDSGTVAIACLDPSGNGNNNPRIDVVQFEVVKTSDNLWQVNLPTEFFDETGPSADDSDDDSDQDVAQAFAAKWSAAHPATAHPTAEMARTGWIAALRDASIKPLLTLSRFPKNAEAATKACLEAARIWWMIHDPSAVRHAMPLAFDADENAAVALIQLFTTRDPDKAEFLPIYFEKSASGWLWSPIPSATNQEKFRGWVDAEIRKWQDQWRDVLLKDCPVVAKFDGAEPPAKDDARKLVEAMLSAAGRGDTETALSFVARLQDPKSAPAILQNLGYEIIGSRRASAPPEITGIYQGKNWTAVGVKLVQGGKSNYPMYPVIQTDVGPRILSEIYISASGTRDREFLNREAFRRLRQISSPEAATELQTLYAEHQEHIERLNGKAPR
jgi:hypothetical protein